MKKYLVVSDDVAGVELDGERVLLNIETGQYYGLNALGAEVFAHAEEHVTVEQVVDLLHESHKASVSREQLVEDVSAFIDDMQEFDLLRLEEAAPTPESS